MKARDDAAMQLANILAHFNIMLTDDQRARFGVYVADGQQPHMAVMRCLSVLVDVDNATGKRASYVSGAADISTPPQHDGVDMALIRSEVRDKLGVAKHAGDGFEGRMAIQQAENFLVDLFTTSLRDNHHNAKTCPFCTPAQEPTP